MVWPAPVVLDHAVVRLEPLQHGHTPALCDAVRDGALWNLWYTAVPTPEGMGAEIQRRLGLQAQGSMLPFAVVAQGPGPFQGQAVGMTSFMHIDAPNRRLEIGSTWYRQGVQKTALNTAAKRLLLGHAFDTLGCIAVEFRTHTHNRNSRRAIERLGAHLDGVLRSHQINQHPLAQGSLRDTCVYSITATEWPTVRVGLDRRLGGEENPPC
ncbi:MAG: putative ribosomal N-acetyltransferase YdaF [Pseudomonadota bacterium]|jgi:RimJ/RimL family protein N-acetyltransferase